MPFMKKVNGKSVRDYTAELEWDKEHRNGKRLRDRADRNAARRAMMKAGKVSVGDGNHVDHIQALDLGGSGRSRSNLKVVSAKTNMQKEVKRKRSRKGNN